MTYRFFKQIATLDELKAEYRRLTKKHHPDCGGDNETMKQVNADYEAKFNELKAAHNAKADEFHQTTETPDEFREIIEKLLKLDGLEVELCGSWLWIGGNTKEHKEELKAAGCRWSNNKKLWYWHHAEEGSHWHRGKRTMGEIRTKYGSQVFNGSAESSKYERIGAAV